MPDDTRSFPDRTRPPDTGTRPDAPAGPHDSSYLFEEFQRLMG